MRRRLIQTATRQGSLMRIEDMFRAYILQWKQFMFALLEDGFEEKTKRMIPIRVAAVSSVMDRQQRKEWVSLDPNRPQYVPGREI